MNLERLAVDRFHTVVEGDGTPQISVLMPVFRQPQFVAEAVRSVLDQADVVAEIIISDDASGDDSWSLAIDAVRSAPSHRHRVVLRRGGRRLRRDHMALLTEQATAEVVMAAHGDDVSEPDRARWVLNELASSGAVLAGSTCTTIDARGRPIPSPIDQTVRVGAGEHVDPKTLLLPGAHFIGSLLAWRPGPLARFARLDSSFAATAHDSVLPFRASLVGGAIVIDRPLVRRRVHESSWSRAIWDERSDEARDFGRQLTYLCAMQAMRADLERARELGLIPPAEQADILDLLDRHQHGRFDQLMAAHHQLVNAGRLPVWLDEDEAALANRGRLGAVLARRARRWAPVERVAAARRRWRRVGQAGRRDR